MDENNILVGKRVFELRKSRGYSREKLAEIADISTTFLSDIEKGRKSMTITVLRKLSTALSVTTDYIVNGSKVEVVEEASEEERMMAMLASLYPFHRRQAEKLLGIFVETISQASFE
ncbi:MAG: helix-turn-helix domain-containing protein [Lachnospiraceae bacterium]|nr:helix-turn-helix domain-containing protein [Ruminococcus sp.]MCM1275214.1 helix-turn-helix domain-containing protein [Lachnospiraceae bacterium]